MSKETRLKILVDYLEVLRSIKVLDLACGSGAFLVAAFDYLIGEYERVNQAIAAQSGAPGQMGLFDLDVVIGNPPYVRQEALGPIKPYLARRYASYHGVADLYVYFYERGLELLAPGGKLSYIVTNKWLRAGYGEPLRKLFSERAELEEILDFGHAPIFEDADVFPCIIVAHPHPGSQAATGDPPQVSICPVPRDRSTELSLVNYVLEHGYSVPWSRYGAQPWSLEPPEVDKLMQKIRERGVPLADFVDAKPMYGIKTGLNEAFLIDDATRTALIRDDPGCAEIIKPYLRGQDIKRWTPDWQGLWMILLKSSGDYEWPWSTLGDDAEAVFARTYPGLYAHVKPLQQRLMARRDKGRFWWELRSCDYYGAFERAKIVYQVIQFHPQYALDATGPFGNDKTFFLPSSDRYVLAVLNSALMWWHNWRYLPHMKDEALNPAGFRMETVPIAEPATELRDEIEEHVDAVLALTRESQECSRELFNWLRLQLGIEKLGQRLAAFADLSGDEFVAEVRKRRPKDASRLTPAAITELNGIHHHYVDPERRRAAEIRVLERRISDLVNQAYQLTNDEIDLLWRTAPPRMPQL